MSPRIDFQTEPARYRHWRLKFDGDVAELVMDVDENAGLFDGYKLKLNSYDLGVDIELSDAVQRLRFEHPEVKVVILRSGKDRVFCAGANIRMLAGASHAHKVNFCKFTNETRNAIEDASEVSGQKYLCAIRGTAAGGGYELALATDYIMLADDGSSTYAPITRPLRLYYSERPEDFATEARAPDQMTFAQLRRYIETIRKSGYAAEELTVKLYTKTSWPFISLVMALIALPFAFRIGKRGALYGVGIGLILGILYWMVFAVFTKFGEVGNLPAMLSAWSANILFAIAAIYMFLNVET